MQLKEIAERAIKTFFEGLLASLIANVTVLSGTMDDTDAFKTAAVSLFVGAVAAGVSAVYNGVIEPLFKKEK